MAAQIPHNITVQQLENWRHGIRGTIWSILETIEILLQNLASPVRRRNVELVTTALYTHALEEYGKLVLFDRLLPNGNTINLDPIRTQLLNHNVKITEALNDLPVECRRVFAGAFDPGIFSPDAFQTHNPVNWNSRLNILNTDIDPNGNVVPTEVVDLDGLQNAITQFHTAQFMR